ncbi:MAG: proline racemase family protein [Hyphomicrobiales bacterium]|nr:proline racemase family protein [Hyphomicrobiales bacterium]
MQVIDSHTEGEPTRIIIAGGPDLGDGDMATRRANFVRHHDAVRRCALLEPRGWDALVGALLCEPVDPACAAGVIFFNKAGMLSMCGHGLMGLAVTLAHLGRIGPGHHRIETPAGEVSFELLSRDTVKIENVAAFRHAANVSVDVPGHGMVHGDIAWGGNWFFLTKDSPCALEARHIPQLTAYAQAIQDALDARGLGGAGAPVDHIEIFGPPGGQGANARSFVMCPGGAYDRSPCGTGTSAKLACLAADGALAPGQTWVQESIIGSRFSAHYRRADAGHIIPTLTGRAWIMAEATLLRDDNDPFADGMAAG